MTDLVQTRHVVWYCLQRLPVQILRLCYRLPRPVPAHSVTILNLFLSPVSKPLKLRRSMTLKRKRKKKKMLGTRTRCCNLALAVEKSGERRQRVRARALASQRHVRWHVTAPSPWTPPIRFLRARLELTCGVVGANASL